MTDASTYSSDSDFNLVAFAGSLRKGSFNKAALNAAVENAPAGINITPIDIRDVPFYDACAERWSR